jgi:hypothetical protein
MEESTMTHSGEHLPCCDTQAQRENDDPARVTKCDCERFRSHRSDGWQPIETAPKDRAVLGWEGKNVIFMRWDDQRFNSRPRPLWRTEMSIAWDRWHQPTHWLPTPEPPK